MNKEKKELLDKFLIGFLDQLASDLKQRDKCINDRVKKLGNSIWNPNNHTTTIKWVKYNGTKNN